MRLLATVGAAALAMTTGMTAAFAAERLSATGAFLPGASYAPGGALEARIDAAGDDVVSVHTILRPASTNIKWMRDRDGFWVEWSGRSEDLIESAARREGDELVFKVFDAPPPGVTSMMVTVAYRTADGLKFGTFNAAERAE